MNAAAEGGGDRGGHWGGKEGELQAGTQGDKGSTQPPGRVHRRGRGTGCLAGRPLALQTRAAHDSPTQRTGPHYTLAVPRISYLEAP